MKHVIAFASVIVIGGCSVTSTDPVGNPPASPSSSPSSSSGSSCTALEDLAAGVYPTTIFAAPPAPAGGVITDGTYVLTSVTYYGDSRGNAKTYGTIRFDNGFAEHAVKPQAQGDKTQFWKETFYFTDGTDLAFTTTCNEDSSVAEGGTRSVHYSTDDNYYIEYIEKSGTTILNTYSRYE